MSAIDIINGVREVLKAKGAGLNPGSKDKHGRTWWLFWGLRGYHALCLDGDTFELWMVHPGARGNVRCAKKAKGHETVVGWFE